MKKKFNKKQQEIIDKLENALTNALYDNNEDGKRQLSYILEELYKGNSVFATIIASLENAPQNFIKEMRDAFDIRHIEECENVNS